MIVQELFATLGLKLDKGSFKAADSALGGLKTVAAGVIAAFGVSKLVDMVKGVADVADAATKASQKLGITTEAVQELGYAAKLSDVEQGELEGGLTRLASGLDEVATKGKGPTADALSRLGISFKDLKGETLDQNLEVIADAFAKMPDGAKKSALAADLFGRQLGSKFIPLLNGGAAGLVEMRAEAQRLGIVVGDETAKQFEEFNDKQTKLSETWRGLKTQVVSGLLPTLSNLVDRLSSFIDRNREIIASGVEQAINGVIVAFEILGDIVSVTIDAFKFMGEHWEATRAILIAFGAVIAVFAAEAAIAWVVAFAPLIAIGLAIAAVALVVLDLWESITKGKGIAASVWNWISNKAQAMGEAIEEVADAIAAPFISAFEEVKARIEQIVGWIMDRVNEVKDAADALANVGRNVGAKVFDFFDTTPEGIDKVSTGGGEVVNAQPTVRNSQLTVGPSTFNVTLPSGDPVENGKTMQKVFDEQWANVLRQTAGGV